MDTKTTSANSHRLTIKILIAMAVGILTGLAIQWLPLSQPTRSFIVDNVLQIGGQLFLNLIKLLVIPVVFVSLVYGSSSLGNFKKLGRVGGKTILLYLATTVIAVTIALVLASLFQVGYGLSLQSPSQFVTQSPLSFSGMIINLIPENPFKALAEGNLLQVIVFSLLLGIAISLSGDRGKRVMEAFSSLNSVLLKLVLMIMQLVPYGVFFLLASLFAKMGFQAIAQLVGYFFAVIVILIIQLFIIYSLILSFLGRLNPVIFFRKMYAAMIFAFSVSSSLASIPVVLETVEARLGVKNAIASFVIPLGATINMDGTAIMQGAATVFIANAYNVHIGFAGYLTVVIMAALASIGTAGVPSIGLITLAMVLQQVGLPVEGIALILGVDRLLDMARTAVNISGDSMVACLVGKSEKAFDINIYKNMKL